MIKNNFNLLKPQFFQSTCCADCQMKYNDTESYYCIFTQKRLSHKILREGKTHEDCKLLNNDYVITHKNNQNEIK